MNKPTIRTARMSDVSTKHHVEGLPVGLVIHEFSAPEPIDADAHDHPGDFHTHVIHGWYKQRIWFLSKITGSWNYIDETMYKNELYFIKAETIHQIIEVAPGGCITSTIWEPARRKSGFWQFDNGKAKFREWDQTEFKTV